MHVYVDFMPTTRLQGSLSICHSRTPCATWPNCVRGDSLAQLTAQGLVVWLLRKVKTKELNNSG